MFIDEAQAMQERNEPLRTLCGNGRDKERIDLIRQLESLDEMCPRYDVYNVYAVLFPALIDTPTAAERNAVALGKRDGLITIAAKAPLGLPWDMFCLEHRYTQRQRTAYLVRGRRTERRFDCTMMFDSAAVQGGIEFIPNAFEIRRDADDMFDGCHLNPALHGANLECARRGSQVVRTCIELLNWDREIIPVQRLTNAKASKNDSRNPAKPRKTDPTIIKFEPFLKAVKEGVERGCCSGENAAIGEYLVRGHYKNFTYEKPLLGHAPVLGKTYGRLWWKPGKRGNPSHGSARAPRAVIEIGNLNHPGSPVSPTTQLGECWT